VKRLNFSMPYSGIHRDVELNLVAHAPILQYCKSRKSSGLPE
jgi:hypothetical protein